VRPSLEEEQYDVDWGDLELSPPAAPVEPANITLLRLMDQTSLLPLFGVHLNQSSLSLEAIRLLLRGS
jgi:hypothetical protein